MKKTSLPRSPRHPQMRSKLQGKIIWQYGAAVALGGLLLGPSLVSLAQNAPAPATPPKPPVPATAPVEAEADRPCVAAPPGLVFWSPAEDKPDDILLGKTSLEGNVAYAPGKVGKSLDFTGGYFKLLASPRTDFGAGTGFTFEAWINPSDVRPMHPIFDFNNGQTFGAHFWIFQGMGTLYANLQDTNGEGHIFSTQENAIKASEWQHIALTYDARNGVGSIYVNGLPAAEKTLGRFRPQTSYDFILGSRPAGLGKGLRYGGQIDEPSLYNRALTAAEIRTIFQAGASGKCNPQKAKPTPTPVAKPTPTPIPAPTPTPTPVPTPTLIPAIKVRGPIAVFSLDTSETGDAAISQRITDALVDGLRKAGYQVKPRQHMDGQFQKLRDALQNSPNTPAVAEDVRDAGLRQRAARDMEANSFVWGKIKQFELIPGKSARLRFEIHLTDSASGKTTPEVVVSEGTPEQAQVIPDEDLLKDLIGKSIPSAVERLKVSLQ